MHTRHVPHVRASVEIACIIFLYYSNLLMGEFTRSAGRHKTLPAALHDIFTLKTMAIAVITAAIGHFGFSILRQRS